MIGFDRPIKPEWIFKLLKMIEVGHNPSEYNLPFEDIPVELIGKEGKRKVRTVIFRSFIYSFQKSRSKIAGNFLIELSNKKNLNYLQPIFLIKLIMDYEIIRFIINKMNRFFDSSKELTTKILTKKMVQEYGDRDIVIRSVRAFLKTLAYFGVFDIIDNKSIRIIKKPFLNAEQIKDVLKLYSQIFIKSKVVDLNLIDKTIFAFNEIPSLNEVAMKYNGKEWEYIKDAHRAILMMKD